ncbi:MAG: hypothetical protein ACK5LX_13025 [Oscillospiraceae bacterium]
MKKTKTKGKRIAIGVVISLLVLLLFAAVVVLQFTSIGYLATIQIRGFTHIAENIYLDNDFQGDSAEILSVIDEATDRVELFWGEIESKPIIVISDNEGKLEKMGWTGNPALTTTIVLNGAHSYVVVSPNGINVDVAAHELTHAELHKRLYKGVLLPKTLIPTWFDEGVATQNDYREKYSYSAWVKATDNGENITDFETLQTAADFYNPDAGIRQYNYIISKHEVREWLELHSVDELIQLIIEVNAGKEFGQLYYSK